MGYYSGKLMALLKKLGYPIWSENNVAGSEFMTALEMVGGKMNEKSSAIAEHLNMKCPSKDELKTNKANKKINNCLFRRKK